MCEGEMRKIDAISINERDASVDLHIFVDNTEADVEEVVRHIEAKVNLCIEFVLSGQRYEAFPRELATRVVVHFRTDPVGREVTVFYDAKDVLALHGIRMLVTVGETMGEYREVL